ncbi:MAG: hypothetical protein WD200_01470 [Candidatus Andersenbacteria bacterium]
MQLRRKRRSEQRAVRAEAERIAQECQKAYRQGRHDALRRTYSYDPTWPAAIAEAYESGFQSIARVA